MKVLVAIKRVVDPYVKIRLKNDGSGVDDAGLKMAINPFCAIAIEQAVQLKEQGLATEVVVVSIGTSACQEQLRTALALGADSAIWVDTGATPKNALSEPITVARTLKEVVVREQPGLVLLGKQAIDGDNNQTGQMLAGLLGWAQGTFSSGLRLDGDAAEVEREVDAGLQAQRLKLPAVITTDLRLNQPRFASLPNIMRARQKPLHVLEIEELLVLPAPEIQVQQVAPPAARKAGQRVESVDGLLSLLRDKEGVL